MVQIRIRIRIILGSWIPIRIRVKSRNRIEVKFQEYGGLRWSHGLGWSHGGPWTLTIDEAAGLGAGPVWGCSAASVWQFQVLLLVVYYQMYTSNRYDGNHTWRAASFL